MDLGAWSGFCILTLECRDPAAIPGLPVHSKQEVPFWLLHRNSASELRVRRMIDLRFAGGTDHARMADTLSRLAKAAC